MKPFSTSVLCWGRLGWAGLGWAGAGAGTGTGAGTGQGRAGQGRAGQGRAGLYFCTCVLLYFSTTVFFFELLNFCTLVVLFFPSKHVLPFYLFLMNAFTGFLFFHHLSFSFSTFAFHFFKLFPCFYLNALHLIFLIFCNLFLMTCTLYA